MIELGLYSFISALIVCINQALTLMPSTSFKVHYRWLVYAQFGFEILSFFCLIWAHVTSDFSVSVVANNTHSLMSPTYKLASVWGQHQGSAFFWFVGISFVSFLFLIIEKQIPGRQMAIIQGVQSLILLLIGSYILIVANPFERSLPFPMEGNGLNPLLQDPGLTYHPPVLFSGHFFFTLLYSLAVTQPFNGSHYKGVVRRWTLISFAFLTLGISLGSFWAYYVLGWGGWWYWAPVEAVSLFPWLILLMSIHAQGAQKNVKHPRSFAAILNVLALLFSVLSTLIVRSGLLTSVHSFAIDGIGTIYLACVFLILLIFGLRSTIKKGLWTFNSPSTDQMKG
ncbi:MAG: hypothetical protein C0582_01510 [Alphaproteobacteria bacterium]|nr:MAG: hypothetical protein C0582_01510 [Alphaproteobacteria bacterium]